MAIERDGIVAVDAESYNGLLAKVRRLEAHRPCVCDMCVANTPETQHLLAELLVARDEMSIELACYKAGHGELEPNPVSERVKTLVGQLAQANAANHLMSEELNLRRGMANPPPPKCADCGATEHTLVCTPCGAKRWLEGK